MIDRLIHALASSKNEAADDVLLEALRLGADREKAIAMGGLFKRQTNRGLGGVIGEYDRLPEQLQELVLTQIRLFNHAIRDSARGGEVDRRLSALRLVALARQGRMAYVLSENLHDPEESVSKAACDALVALARWAAGEVRRLQTSTDPRADSEGFALLPPDPAQFTPAYQQLIEQRGEIEAAVARAIDIHRGRHGSDLLRAAMLLADNPTSKTFQILQSTKHGGQSPMVRRMQQLPASEHVAAFLLGASVGQLRGAFGNVFCRIEEPPVLDALLRKTHWLKDNGLQICMHQVSRGPWWDDESIVKDAARRTPAESAKIAEWIGASGTHDVVQDGRIAKLVEHAKDDFDARLRILQVLMHRKRGSSTHLIASFLDDADERLARMAAREIVRRRPADMESVLLQRVSTSPESIRRIISRAIGQVGFDSYWERFDRLPRQTRKQAGRAMLKILPDAVNRLGRKLAGGPVEQRIKAMQICHELGLAEPLRNELLRLCTDPNARLRSKAISVVGGVASVPPDMLIDRLLHDSDARVRANTIEVLESKQRSEFLPVLAKRARATNPRERANAIKALHQMRVGSATTQLQSMLADDRSEHRISGLWALRQIGWWQLLSEVGRLAKHDKNLRVRRYALAVLRGVAELAAEQKTKKAASA